MARPLRIDVPDGVYHVTSRGLGRRAIVRGDRDRTRWLELLGEVATRCEWRVLACALMDNHFHLDPVRAGLAARLEAYPWSSCGAYLGRRAPPGWLAWEEVLCEHGRRLRAARREYARFLADGLGARLESPLRDAVASSLLGSPSFVERTRRWVQDRLPDRDVPAARALRQHVSVSEIAAEVARAAGVPAESLRQRGRWGNDARGVAVYLTRRLTPTPLAQIGSFFGGVKGSAAALIVRRIAQRRTKERRLNSLVSALEAGLMKNQTSKT